MKTLILMTRKPRNPYVVASLRRKAGAHRRTASTRRQAATRALHEELARLDQPEP